MMIHVLILQYYWIKCDMIDYFLLRKANNLICYVQNCVKLMKTLTIAVQSHLQASLVTDQIKTRDLGALTWVSNQVIMVYNSSCSKLP